MKTRKVEIITAFENLDADALERLLDDGKTYQDVPKKLFVQRYRGRRYGDFVNDLKSDLRTKVIPIIMMSFSYPGEYFFNIAANDFMSKPLNLELFLEKVKNYLN